MLQASRESLSEQIVKMELKAPAPKNRKRGWTRKAETAQDVTPVLDAVGPAIRKNERAARV